MASIENSFPSVRKENTSSTDYWCHSKIEENVVKCFWTIDHFSWRKEKHPKYIESSPFPEDAPNDVPKWRIRVYPSVPYIRLSVYNESKVDATFNLSILNDKKEKTNTVALPRAIYSPGESYTTNYFLDRRTLEMNAAVLLPHDTLTILCEVCVRSDNVNVSGQICAPFKAPPDNLSEDFQALLDNEQFSDVTLVGANGHELKAHKIILAARSKVFAAMFQHKMEENILNRVNIADINHEVLTEMLRYIYTDKVPNLMAMAEELWTASDKYALENLKAMCEESLRENITINNAASTLILADRHNGKQLKSEAIDFIIHNVFGVVESQGWRDMTKTHAHLIVEAFISIASKQFQYIST